MSTPELMPTAIEALREELERVNAELKEYVGHEPTIAEEMKHLSEENEILRGAVAFLMTAEDADRTTIDLWNDDLDAMTGYLDIELSPNGKEGVVRFVYTRPFSESPMGRS